MNFHFALGHFFLRVGAYFRSMAIMTMRPDDLISFTKKTYSDPNVISALTSEDVINSGLMPHEKQVIDHLPEKNGRLLLLGLGGGREVIPLSQMGFKVTGVEYVSELAACAVKHAQDHSVDLEVIIQDINELSLPGEQYDVVCFSRSMYSSIPSRKRRVNMLKRLREILKPNGYVVCQFRWNFDQPLSSKGLLARRLVAFLTLGNLSYEPGDKLLNEIEFTHAFQTGKELLSEFDQAGFEVVHVEFFKTRLEGGAILCKRPDLKGS
jgi:SAM-dependent methyltransferase